MSTAAAAKSLQLCPTLCDPIDGSPQGSSVHRILQSGILEWVAISFSNASMHVKSRQSCLTLCDTMDSSPPGSVHRILQSRILEWVATVNSHSVNEKIFPQMPIVKKLIAIQQQKMFCKYYLEKESQNLKTYFE